MGGVLDDRVGASWREGICSLPLCDWFRRRVYALFPRAIGSGGGYLLSSLVRLVPAEAICSLPSCDWFRRYPVPTYGVHRVPSLSPVKSKRA
eukprot:2259380-Pyramimonas_sp.AAC.1